MRYEHACHTSFAVIRQRIDISAITERSETYSLLSTVCNRALVLTVCVVMNGITCIIEGTSDAAVMTTAVTASGNARGGSSGVAVV
jgi:hypothetical protein